LLDRLGLADAAVARGVKTNTVEIYEQGRRAASFKRKLADVEKATEQRMHSVADLSSRTLLPKPLLY
jgi:hypothetical protein